MKRRLCTKWAHIHVSKIECPRSGEAATRSTRLAPNSSDLGASFRGSEQVSSFGQVCSPPVIDLFARILEVTV